MGKPTTPHFAAAKRFFRSMKGTPDFPIIYSVSKTNLDLKDFCDSSDGNFGAEGKMRSTAGMMMFLANGPIHFSSNPQLTIPTSTTEAKLIALARGGTFGTYFFNILRKLESSSIRPPTIFSDSRGALHLS
ncbi:unnamed protein product [Sphacelaria rigidula]